MENACSEYIITLRKTEFFTVRVHAQSKVEAVDLAIERERIGEADSSDVGDVKCIHVEVVTDSAKGGVNDSNF